MGKDADTSKKNDIDTLDNKSRFVPIENIVELAEKGLSYTEIGKLLGCSKQAISQRLQKLNYSPGMVKAFKKNRADTLALLQSRIVHSLTEGQIKKMSPRDRVIAFGVLYDKERLETGQSTTNVSMFEHIVEQSHTNPKRYT